MLCACMHEHTCMCTHVCLFLCLCLCLCLCLGGLPRLQTRWYQTPREGQRNHLRRRVSRGAASDPLVPSLHWQTALVVCTRASLRAHAYLCVHTCVHLVLALVPSCLAALFLPVCILSTSHTRRNHQRRTAAAGQEHGFANALPLLVAERRQQKWRGGGKENMTVSFQLTYSL